MLLPIPCVQVGIGNRRSTVNHHSIPHIYPTVGNTRRIIGPLEKHQITRAGVGWGYRRTQVTKALRSPPSHIPAAVIDNPADETGAVK